MYNFITKKYIYTKFNRLNQIIVAIIERHNPHGSKSI